MEILTRDEARGKILHDIPCTDYLEKARNGGYVCIYCGSGKGEHGTGAVKYYRDTNTCACFACADGSDKGRKFDVLDLIQHYERCDYNTALKMGADKLGLTIGAGDRIDNGWKSHKAAQTAQNAVQTAERHTSAQHEEIPTADATKPYSHAQQGTDSAESKKSTTAGTLANYTDYYMECMQRLDDPAAISYLQARGISQGTAESYHIGFDPAADPASAPGAQEGEYKPHPCPRVIVPVTKSHYIARSIDPNTPPRYRVLNPSTQRGAGNPGIFNGKAIYTDGVIFVVEGVFDALSIIECGGVAIATNSANNIKTLKEALFKQKTAAVFVLCPDNDGDPKTQEKVQKRFKDLADGLQALGIRHMIKNIAGAHKDANDALRADRQALETAIKEAIKEAAGLPEIQPAADQDAQADYLTDFFTKISGDDYRPYTTELPFFDDLLDGGPIRQTTLLLLAAPGAGKTTLCQQIAESMAEHGKPVLYLNLEMSREQMIAKSISARCTLAGVPMNTLEVMQGYKWTDAQREAVNNAVNEYRQKIAPCLQYNPDGVSGDLDAIKEYLHKVGESSKSAGQPAPVVVLDYLHLVTCRGSDVQETVKQSIKALKDYAQDYETVSIVISATNRDSNRAGRITLESGRDSSGIEYTGDYILSLNYYQVDQGTVKPSETEKLSILQGRAWRQMVIRVLKGRFCVPGKPARVYFNAANNRFYPADTMLPADAVAFFDPDPELQNAGQALEANPYTSNTNGTCATLPGTETTNKRFKGRQK